jgi:iron complex outermembrane receptor protein
MKTKHGSMLLAGASAIALAPAALVAQEAIELDAIVVTATTDVTTQADGYRADYNQSATKSDTPVAETPQSVSVVTAQQIKDQGAETLGQALRYSPGVLGDPYGVDPRFDSPTIRGFEARGSQYVNGLRQLRYMGAPAYETFALQQIEVLNGPNSSLYGAGSPAGIINQVQKRAQGFDFGELGVGLDDNGSRQTFFDWNRTVSDTLSFRATGIIKDYKSQVEEIGLERDIWASPPAGSPPTAPRSTSSPPIPTTRLSRRRASPSRSPRRGTTSISASSTPASRAGTTTTARSSTSATS